MRAKIFITFIAFLSIGISTALQAKEFYKWTDENGVTHYTRTPPPGKKVDKVRTSNLKGSKTSTATPVRQQSDDTAAQPTEGTPDTEAQEQQEEDNFKDPEICKQARKNIETFKSTTRIRIKDKDGEFRFLDAKELVSKRKEAEAAAKKHCQ